MPICEPARRWAAGGRLGGMNTNSAYLINAILVLLVVRQIREHRLDLRSLAVPVLAVGAAAVLFLHSVPVRGNDLPLELICVSAGAVMGGLAGLATYLRRGGAGRGGWPPVCGSPVWAPGWRSCSPPPTGLARRSAGSASRIRSPARTRG